MVSTEMPRNVQSTKIFMLPSKCEIIFVTILKWYVFDSNIGLFSIAPHLFIALPTLR